MLQNPHKHCPQSKQRRTGGPHLWQIHCLDRFGQSAHRTRRTEYIEKKYDESLTTIQEKDDSLSAKQYIIIGLCVLAAILAVALVIGAIVLLRLSCWRASKKGDCHCQWAQWTENQIHSEHFRPNGTDLGYARLTVARRTGITHFLRSHPRVVRVGKQFVRALWSTGTEHFNFLRERHGQIRSKVQEDVVLTVNAPKLNVKSIQSIWNASCYICWRIPPNTLRQAERYGWISKTRCPYTSVHHQWHRLRNSRRTTREYIQAVHRSKRLDSRRRIRPAYLFAHCHQMNGSLTLDSGYTKGARFVLELHA